jgi:biopolymer transport protein ExbD
VTAPGKVIVEGTTYDLKSLGVLLHDARERYPDQGVLVRGDARLSYQDIADVLAACEAAGIQNVRLPVRPRERRSPAAK